MGKRKNPNRPISKQITNQQLFWNAIESIMSSRTLLSFITLFFGFVIFLIITFTYLEAIGFEATVIFLLTFIAMFVGLRSLGWTFRRRYF